MKLLIPRNRTRKGKGLFVEPTPQRLAHSRTGLRHLTDRKNRRHVEAMTGEFVLNSRTGKAHKVSGKLFLLLLELFGEDGRGDLYGRRYGWFNKYDQLVCTRQWLAEKYTRRWGEACTARQIGAALKVLAGAKLLYRARRQVSEHRWRIYLRFNVGVCLEKMRQCAALQNAKKGQHFYTACDEASSPEQNRQPAPRGSPIDSPGESASKQAPPNEEEAGCASALFAEAGDKKHQTPLPKPATRSTGWRTESRTTEYLPSESEIAEVDESSSLESRPGAADCSLKAQSALPRLDARKVGPRVDQEKTPSLVYQSPFGRYDRTREEERLMYQLLGVQHGEGESEKVRVAEEDKAFGPTVQEVLFKLRTQEILAHPETGQNLPAKLTPDQKAKIARLVTHSFLTPAWLDRYRGAIHGFARHSIPEQVSETWWLKADPDTFIKWFWLIRAKLNAAQAREDWQNFNNRYNITDLDQGWEEAQLYYRYFVESLTPYWNNRENLRRRLLENPGTGLDPVYAIWCVNRFRDRVDGLMPGLAQEVIERHQSCAGFLLVNEYVHLLFAMRHGQLPIEAWYGLKPKDLARASDNWLQLQATYLTCAKQLEERVRNT